MGILINGEEIWMNKLERVKLYIDENLKRPCCHDKNISIKQLAIWLYRQNQNYKNKTQIMSNEEIYNKWANFINDDKYKKYFISNLNLWITKFNLVKEYIDLNKKKPSTVDNNDNIKILGNWLSTQLTTYANNTKIMKNQIIRLKWEEFINQYKIYIFNDEIWNNKFNELKAFINQYNKLPSIIDDKHLNYWRGHQVANYKNKLQIMNTNEDIYNEWSGFINDIRYKKYFMSRKDEWLDKLQQVKNYIDINKRIPTRIDKTIDYGRWIETQKTNYKNKNKIMLNEEIYDIWTNFINDDKYIIYFKSNKSLNNEDVIIEQIKKKVIKSKNNI
jgi:hypothetical protein